MGVLLAIVSGFASGVFLRSVYSFSWHPIIFILLLAALLSAAYFLKQRRRYLVGGLFFLFMALGMGRGVFADTPAPETFMRDLKHRVSYQGVVIGDPDLREKSQRIPVRVTSLNAESVGTLAVMPLSPVVRVGDTVRVNGTLSLPEAFATDGGRTFRYDKYLEARGIRFLIEFGSIRVEESPATNVSFEIKILAQFARVKHAFLDGLDRALPKQDAALAGGIVIGGKQGLGTALTDAFTRSGLVQIIVLSGYNVMIVAEWVMVSLAFLHLPRRLQFFAGSAALLLFVGVAGISSTAVRAAIMALIALYARATGRSYYASRALLFAVLLMLIWNPLYLVFDPGFSLSVAATAGIIWLSPIIESHLGEQALLRVRRVFYAKANKEDIFMGPTLPKPDNTFWKNAVATTVAAQVSVLPILLYNIGLFSLVALPANLIVNPLVPISMASSVIAGVVGMTIGRVVPLIATLAGTPTFVLTRYFIFIAEKSAALPFSAFMIDRFPFVFVLAAYAALIYIYIASRRKAPFLGPALSSQSLK